MFNVQIETAKAESLNKKHNVKISIEGRLDPKSIEVFIYSRGELVEYSRLDVTRKENLS